MLQPIRTAPRALAFLHTHLVRGGYLMLQPTASAGTTGEIKA